MVVWIEWVTTGQKRLESILNETGPFFMTGLVGSCYCRSWKFGLQQSHSAAKFWSINLHIGSQKGKGLENPDGQIPGPYNKEFLYSSKSNQIKKYRKKFAHKLLPFSVRCGCYQIIHKMITFFNIKENWNSIWFDLSLSARVWLFILSQWSYVLQLWTWVCTFSFPFVWIPNMCVCVCVWQLASVPSLLWKQDVSEPAALWGLLSPLHAVSAVLF